MVCFSFQEIGDYEFELQQAVGVAHATRIPSAPRSVPWRPSSASPPLVGNLMAENPLLLPLSSGGNVTGSRRGGRNHHRVPGPLRGR